MSESEFDYIVVGAGSAGCAIASRLSEDENCRVCLIEGGVSDDTPRVQIPSGLLTLQRSEYYSYQYKSVPQGHLNDREIPSPRGRVLGGSSSMNSMVYIRGHASDYDKWEAMGCAGWGYKDVLPFFKFSEHNMLGQESEYHGTEGELFVDRPRQPNVFSRMFVEAGKSLQLPENTDFNGAKLEGVGIYNVTQKDGRRCSSYRAFIHPVRHRKNLTLLVGWSVEKLTVDGLAVTGVSIARAGERVHLKSRCETILSAGAYGSPEILMKSGVGDAEELRAVGIDPVHDLPEVGKNLQDHLDCVTTYRCADHRSLGVSWRALPQIVTAPLRYFGWKRGWMTTNYVEAGGFAKTRYADDVPDVQFHFVPAYRSVRGRLLETGHGFAVHTCVLRPRSRGRVSLVNSDRGPQLRIDFNFLADEHDGKVLIEGLRLARRILSAPPLSEVTGQEIGPGADKTTDDQLLAYIRELARTVYHPSGTCRMGIGNDCVVRPDLTVYGMERLRVADASVMPLLVSGNTNAPSIMIGERCAHFIRSNRSPH